MMVPSIVVRHISLSLLMKRITGVILMLALSGCASIHQSPSCAIHQFPMTDDPFPTSFEIFVTNYDSGIQVKLEDDHLLYAKTAFVSDGGQEITPTAEQWTTFWREAEEADIWCWQPTYTPPVKVFDGMAWSINISHDGRSVSSSGNNAYPADSNPAQVSDYSERFDHFMDAVQHLIGEDKIW